MKLTAQSAQAWESLPPGSVLWDEMVPGLHLRRRKESCSYFIHYRNRDGYQRHPKIGDVRLLSLTEARARARKLLAQVADGADPSGDIQAKRAAPTMASLCERYLEDDRVRAKKSFAEDRRIIEKIILPHFGNRKVASMEPADFESLRKACAATPYKFNRTLALASTIFGRAEVWKMRAQGTNPTKGVHRYPEKKRRRYMKPAEALAISEALNRKEDEQPAGVAFIRLLILTGARPDEIARARWEWLQIYETSDKKTRKKIRGGVIHDPDSKTGERDIHLSPRALEVVESLPRMFDTLTGIKSPKKLWWGIRDEAGCPDLRLYDLRHSFASVAIGLGMTLGQIGELLGHASTQTTQRYAHLMDEDKRAAVTRIAAQITHDAKPARKRRRPLGS